MPAHLDTAAVHDQSHAPIGFPAPILEEDVNYLRELLPNDVRLFKLLSGLDISDQWAATDTVDREALASR
jgi:hypothetical protein